MRWRCLRRGNAGRKGVTSLGSCTEEEEPSCESTVTVRCSHFVAVVWRAWSSSLETVLRGKRRLRFEKTLGYAK